jgi:hypothetical protein
MSHSKKNHPIKKKINKKNHVFFMPHAFNQNGHPLLINVNILNQVVPSKKS